MTRRFFFSVLIAICAQYAWADSESLYVYRNDGEFNYFLTEELDSVVYSCTDLEGNMHPEPVVQEFWQQGKTTRIPIEAIDSVSFISPEENLWLVDPTRIKVPSADAHFNPNVLVDYMESIRLVSFDTTTMKGQITFTADVPELYKGAILAIPDGNGHNAMLRILESRQDGRDAFVHVYPVGPEEIFFDIDVSLGGGSSPAPGRNGAAASEDVPWVNFAEASFNKNFDIGVSFNLDNMTFEIRPDVHMVIGKASEGSALKAVIKGDIERVEVGAEANFHATCHVEVHPTATVKVGAEWDWKKEVVEKMFPVKIPGCPLPLEVNVSVDLKGSWDLSLKTGQLTLWQPFEIDGHAKAGVRYVKGGKSGPYGERSLKFIRKEPKVEHTPEYEIEFTGTPIYPSFNITFFKLPVLIGVVNVKPAVVYKAECIVLDGQEHFQHSVDAQLTVDGALQQGSFFSDERKTLAQTRDYKLGTWKIWSEPAKLENLDSLRNDYMMQKTKLKRTIPVHALKRDDTEQTQMARTPVANPVKVEVHTRAKVANPTTPEGMSVMSNFGKPSKAVDEKGYFEWANEYCEVDTVTSTITPIHEMHAPAGIDTRQVITFIDADGNIIDSTEVVPITAIKAFDIVVRNIENNYDVPVSYDTIVSTIHVRDFGNMVEEHMVHDEHYFCGDCLCMHHIHSVGDGIADNGHIQTTMRLVPGLSSLCPHRDYSDYYINTSEILPTFGGWYMRQGANPLYSFNPDRTDTHGANDAEKLDATRWFIDNGLAGDDAPQVFAEDTYRGLDCISVVDEEGKKLYYWLNIMLGSSTINTATQYSAISTESLVLLPDTIPGQPHGEEPIVVIDGPDGCHFGDGNAPEAHVTAADKPNHPADLKPGGENDDDDDGDDDGGIGLGADEWLNKWNPGIYEFNTGESCLVLAVSSDGWTYFIPDSFDHEGDNLITFDDMPYDYDGYDFIMPCGFKWCDSGRSAYYFVENPAPAAGQPYYDIRKFQFADRATMCGLMTEYGCYDIMIMLNSLPQMFLKRVADAGTHDETFQTLLSRYASRSR